MHTCHPTCDHRRNNRHCCCSAKTPSHQYKIIADEYQPGTWYGKYFREKRRTQGQPRKFLFLSLHFVFILLHVSISTGDSSSAGENTSDAECGCSRGLSRDLPAAGHDSSSSDSGGGSSTATQGATAADADGMATTANEAAGEGDGMVFVEAGEFRFGTDTPFIAPVCTYHTAVSSSTFWQRIPGSLSIRCSVRVATSPRAACTAVAFPRIDCHRLV